MVFKCYKCDLELIFCPKCDSKLHNYAYYWDDILQDFRTDYQCWQKCDFQGYILTNDESRKLKTDVWDNPLNVTIHVNH